MPSKGELELFVLVNCTDFFFSQLKIIFSFIK